jgi:septal ring factor EnvC (AmiA/AmiB activator)
MSDFEAWWATEPFGFDHPDTKAGIKELLDNRDNKIQSLEAEIERLKYELNTGAELVKGLECELGELKNHIASLQQLYIDSKRINDALEKKLEVAVFLFNEIADSDLIASNLKSMAKRAANQLERKNDD